MYGIKFGDMNRRCMILQGIKTYTFNTYVSPLITWHFLPFTSTRTEVFICSWIVGQRPMSALTLINSGFKSCLMINNTPSWILLNFIVDTSTLISDRCLKPQTDKFLIVLISGSGFLLKKYQVQYYVLPKVENKQIYV